MAHPRLALVLGALVAAVAVLAPSTAQAEPGSDSAGDTPPGSGWIRTGQFVAGLAPVDIKLTAQSGSTMELGERVAYGDVSSYQKMPPGSYTVSVRPQGADASTPMLRKTMTVAAGKAGTVALLGTKAAPRLATLTDDLASPAAGSARVRVISGSSNADDLTIQAINGPLIASDVVLGQTTPYATVPDGDWTLRLESKGTDPMRAPITLASGAVYTAVVLDGRAKGAITVSLVTDAQGASTMPKGAAATGLGGTATAAPSSGPTWPPVVGLASVLVLGLGALGAWRAPRRPAAGR